LRTLLCLFAATSLGYAQQQERLEEPGVVDQSRANHGDLELLTVPRGKRVRFQGVLGSDLSRRFEIRRKIVGAPDEVLAIIPLFASDKFPKRSSTTFPASKHDVVYYVKGFHQTGDTYSESPADSGRGNRNGKKKERVVWWGFGSGNGDFDDLVVTATILSRWDGCDYL